MNWWALTVLPWGAATFVCAHFAIVGPRHKTWLAVWLLVSFGGGTLLGKTLWS